jgi:heme-degrading monooxygenase HmoA
MSYTSVIRFRVKPGFEATFEDAFAKAGMLTRPKAIAGFVRAELVRSVGEPVEYYVIGEWQTQQSYTEWQAVSGPGADPAVLAAMRETLVDHAPRRLFEVVVGWGY